MHVFENFLPTWLHKKVSEQLLSPYLDWHFPGFGGLETDINKSIIGNQEYNLKKVPFVLKLTINFSYLCSIRISCTLEYQ